MTDSATIQYRAVVLDVALRRVLYHPFSTQVALHHPLGASEEKSRMGKGQAAELWKAGYVIGGIKKSWRH